MIAMASLFFSYSHADEDLRNKLEVHLAMLKHQGIIDTWHDRRIPAGDDLDSAISAQLDIADVILLLVSSDFLASRYCYDIEMQRAIERHNAGEARVIPVILRHCDWHAAPFGKLMATPKDARPIKSWPDIDEAFLDVVQSIKRALKDNGSGTAEKAVEAPPKAPKVTKPPTQPAQPRSSNLRMRKEFTDADRDAFLDESFEFIAAFFENSLKELQARNPELSTRFRRVDGNKFTAAIYKNGSSVARCKIALGGFLGSGIAFSHSDEDHDRSWNESMSVEDDGHMLHLNPMGMAMQMRGEDRMLSQEGAAEYLWGMLVQSLQ